MSVRLLENVTAIRLGPGVVSKITLAFGLTEVAVTAVALTAHDDNIRIGGLALLPLLFVVYLFVIFRIMKRFPQLALLEGSDLLAYYAHQGTMGFPEAASTGLTTNPERPDPLSLPRETQ